ncbi:hypothetical protein JJB09_14840 [Rhizobium sp. KVB221]|uniref:Alpha glucuronidase N-terminal domain-containing protein n=1 Tax=Rhizobium setariae TaxID=2801340 RepID=A0A937CQQ4_9HYPH|nr:hypothetical protein [Rhizobium setariae]MBL0373312.1 hypothetical protein [Rhizobium setariae]
MVQNDNIAISGQVLIEGGQAFPHAANRLKDTFSGLQWRDRAPNEDAAQPIIRLTGDAGLAEGAFRISTASGSNGAPIITVAGGPFSGVIYGVEELIRRGGANSGLLNAGSAPIEAAPGLAYRTFWTWDHSTNWELSQIGQQEIGVFNPFQKPPSGFLADYKRLVDWCSINRVPAVVIYGFLRDTHGGIETAQELCRYANARGVRIVPGVAIGAYGGVYWEGDHPYNLSTWLKKYPQYAATLEKGVGFQLEDLAFPLNFPRSDYTMTACPSAPETMDWMEEAVSWLAETFEIGGINIESGDYGVCGCARCSSRRNDREDSSRRAGDTDESWSHADMMDNFPRLFAAANAKRKDLWTYCELQWDNLLDPVAHNSLHAMPEGAIYQHTANKTYWGVLKDKLKRDYVEALPTQPNVLRCQFACQWNGDERTERYALNAKTFASMAQKSHEVGMQGLTVWGEPSPYHANVELSYLAFARFSYDPTLTWDRFIEDDVAPMLGGRKAADRYVAIAEEIDANATLSEDRLEALQAEALDASRGRPREVARRWMTLADQIGRRLYMGR